MESLAERAEDQSAEAALKVMPDSGQGGVGCGHGGGRAGAGRCGGGARGQHRAGVDRMRIEGALAEVYSKEGELGGEEASVVSQ